MSTTLPKFTLEEYAEFVKHSKPHLLKIDEAITKMEGGYGTLEIKMEVRAGVVNKMSFWSGEMWLSPKQQQGEQLQVTQERDNNK